MKQLGTSAIVLGTLVALIVVCGCGGTGLPGRVVDRAEQDSMRRAGTGGPGAPSVPDAAAVERVAAACMEDLASRLEVSPQAIEIEVVGTEAVDWPSPALGCPRPGYDYIQVVVPGYRVLLEVNGRTHEYHTDRCGCVVYYPSLLVAHCTADLASRLGTAAEAVDLVGIEEVMWPDAALGCPAPGMDYTQKVVPGFRIVLGPGGLHEYHTDTMARCVYCPPDRVAQAQ